MTERAQRADRHDRGATAPWGDADLRRRYADLLLSARLAGRRVLFYVLVEHKRDVEPLAVVQVGRYMHRVWDKVVGDTPGLAKLPEIFAVGHDEARQRPDGAVEQGALEGDVTAPIADEAGAASSPRRSSARPCSWVRPGSYSAREVRGLHAR